jgi:hypothetical protein
MLKESKFFSEAGRQIRAYGGKPPLRELPGKNGKNMRPFAPRFSR